LTLTPGSSSLAAQARTAAARFRWHTAGPAWKERMEMKQASMAGPALRV
jgi:hypothetical protein